MKIEVPEKQTTAQFISSMNVEDLAALAADQGYPAPFSKAESIHKSATKAREQELGEIFGHARRVGDVAARLLVVKDQETGGVAIVTEKEFENSNTRA